MSRTSVAYPAVDWAHVDVEYHVDLAADRLAETDGDGLIRIGERLLQVERRGTLTHELIHLERGDTSVCTPSAERDIDREAARRLVSLETLQGAVRWTLERGELAEELWVTKDLVGSRFEKMTGPELLVSRPRRKMPTYDLTSVVARGRESAMGFWVQPFER